MIPFGAVGLGSPPGYALAMGAPELDMCEGCCHSAMEWNRFGDLEVWCVALGRAVWVEIIPREWVSFFLWEDIARCRKRGPDNVELIHQSKATGWKQPVLRDVAASLRGGGG